METYPNLVKSAALAQLALSNAGIDSIVIGGLAVAIWGEPRLTRDVDLKVLLRRDQAEQLVKALPRGFRCLADQPEATLRRIGFLFVQDTAGIRVDFLMADTGFDVEAVSRKRKVEMIAERIAVCTPEDLIVYKMVSTRPRDHDDVRGVIRRQQDRLDDDYVTSWLRQFEQALDDSTLVSSYRRMRNAEG
ncbi:MAG TPA: nucleotidyltransferase [Blastocatellia bacterium]|nr:nucleotidyltransferase [Blastocatellia bacterium]